MCQSGSEIAAPRFSLIGADSLASVLRLLTARRRNSFPTAIDVSVRRVGGAILLFEFLLRGLRFILSCVRADLDAVPDLAVHRSLRFVRLVAKRLELGDHVVGAALVH